nr:DUF6456 domain-containing protein [uncultured Cohaesibacter sp.]
MTRRKSDDHHLGHPITRAHISLLSPNEVRLLKACLKSPRTKEAKAGKAKKEEDKAALESLLRRGCLRQCEGQVVVTSEGRQALRRVQLAKDEQQIFAAQHQVLVSLDNDKEQKRKSTKDLGRQSVSEPVKKPTPRINKQESPLAMLAIRKRPDGSPILSSCQLEAGERFRQDFELGQMAPMMGINWDKLGEAGGSGKGQGPLGRNDISDSAMGARKRFSKAVLYVGDELSGVLIDFCCFLKGLEAIERERKWPARSAKQILSLALDRLARHYGLSEKAQGPERNFIQHWGTEDFRPQM